MVAIVAPASFGIAAFLLAWTLFAPKREARQRWRDEALHGKREPVREVRQRRRENLRTKSLFERVITAPPRPTEPANKLVGAAGLADRMTGASFAGFALIVGAGLLLAWLLIAASGGFSSLELFITILVAAFGFGAPWVMLAGRASRRRNAIDLAVPDLLDLLTVSVEAGLAIEAALVRVSERGASPLQP